MFNSFDGKSLRFPEVKAHSERSQPYPNPLKLEIPVKKVQAS
ncbi:hypothetical protein Q5692_14355 [Microcoleus sp. C2C3]